MNIEELVSRIRRDVRCNTLRPSAIPSVDLTHLVPDDVRSFYHICGGIALFPSKEYSLRIVGDTEVQPINEVIYRDAEDILQAARTDISASWYIIADNRNRNFTTIDFSPTRLGTCYDSSFEGHGVAGSCPIIARSFAEFLDRSYKNNGDYWYWLKDDFQTLGDAYDQEEV